MEIWQMVTGFVVTIAAVITAMKTITAPIKKKLNDISNIEKRVADLESWTEKQQDDLQDVTEKLTLVFNATLALLDHAITKQGGNGECHKAQEEMNLYIQSKLAQLKSYKYRGENEH
jgi:hypothetical protein